MNRSLLFTVISLALLACHSAKQNMGKSQPTYLPADKNLHDTIVKLDSLFFNAYNTCAANLDLYASFYADDIEFYHDKGGVMKSKKDIVESTRTNVCGKVTRELIRGSIEVYPIANYGAVEIGYHTFRNNTEPLVANPHPGRFVVIWRKQQGKWQITRVISLH